MAAVEVATHMRSRLPTMLAWVAKRLPQGQEQERTGKTDDDLRRQARGKEEMRRVEMAVAKKGCQDTVCTRASTMHALDLPCLKSTYVLDVVIYTQAKQRDLESDEAKLAAFAEKRRKAEAASTWIIEKGMTSSDATVDEGCRRLVADRLARGASVLAEKGPSEKLSGAPDSTV